MPDRSSELLRQRALVAEHLAWLDREIADLKALRELPTGTASLPHPELEAARVVDSASAHATRSPEPRTAAPDSAAARARSTDVIRALAPNVAPGTEVESSETEVILEQYRVTPAAVKQDVRKGCFLYFVGAFVVLGVIVAILYFAIGSP